MNIVVPENTVLSKVKVFSAGLAIALYVYWLSSHIVDKSLALNVFSFESIKSQSEFATESDCYRLFKLIDEIRGGAFEHDKKMPKYDESLHSRASILDYIHRCSPAFVRLSDPRRFLIQRELFEKVRGSEGVALHMELAEKGSHETWITIAASNVLPEVLLRLCTYVLVGHQVNIQRAHLDSVSNSEYPSGDIPAFVTMLRLLVDLDPGAADVKTLLKDLQRAKWLDGAVVELGLVQHPSLGLDKAEVIYALCSMLHGYADSYALTSNNYLLLPRPLVKMNSYAYASVKNIVQLVTGKEYLLQITANIASLFLMKFDPASPTPPTTLADWDKSILLKINGVQNEAARVALLRILEGR